MTTADPDAIMAELEKLKNLLEARGEESLLKTHFLNLFQLTRDAGGIRASWMVEATRYGSTLNNCIIRESVISGRLGLLACDPDCYRLFYPLFSALIREYHGISTISSPVPHPPVDWGVERDLTDLFSAVAAHHVPRVSEMRICAMRNLQDMPFTPRMTEEDFLSVSRQVSSCVRKFGGELKGSFYDLETVTSEQVGELRKNHALFTDCDKHIESVGGYRYHPRGRGIYTNENKSLLIWVNHGDHLTVVSRWKKIEGETDAEKIKEELRSVYRRIIKVFRVLKELGLQFVSDCTRGEFGFLGISPCDVGTAMSISVSVHLPNLVTNQLHLLPTWADKLGLLLKVPDCGSVVDIKNKRKLGVSEIQAMRCVALGVEKLLQADSEDPV